MRSRSIDPGGFVILVVLLMMVVISAVAIGQLSVVQSAQVVGLRREEEAQARAIAEGCLALLTKHAELFIDPDSYPNTSPPSDFDLLLNPNGNISLDGDEHVPTVINGVNVVMPITASGTSQHQWHLIPRSDGDPATPDGACLVRYEDNSDDALPSSAVVADSNNDCDPNENPSAGALPSGIDIPWCDRDGSIYLSAIGLYPVVDVNQDAYAQAHARVTLRKLFAVAKASSLPPALRASEKVAIDNNSTICGAGGITANEVDVSSNGNSCVCGAVKSAGSPVDVPTAAFCPSCAQCDQSSLAVGVQSPRKFEITPVGDACVPATNCAQHPADQLMPSSPMQQNFGTFMSADGFGNPSATTVAPGAVNLPADKQTCEFFLQKGTHGELTNGVYYWDSSDTDTAATFSNSPPNRYGLSAAIIVPAENCAIASYAAVPLPCTWTLSAPSVTCEPKQSACWKPLAQLNGTAGEDIEIGDDVKAAMDNASGEVLFNKAPIPNAADANATFDTTATDTLCGSNGVAPGACSSCNGNNPAIDFKDGTFRLKGSNTTMPTPAFVAVGPDSDSALTLLNTDPTVDRPLAVTVLVNGVVAFSGENSLCGALVDCSAMTTRSISLANCTTTPYPANAPFFSWNPSASDTAGNLDIPSYVVKASGKATIGDGNTFFGLLRVQGELTINGGSCFVGRVMTDDKLEIVGTTAAIGVKLQPKELQTNGQFLAVGEIHGKQSVQVRGDLFSESNLKFKNNFTLIGRAAANGTIQFKNNATVTWDGGGATGTFGTSALSSFIESQW